MLRTAGWAPRCRSTQDALAKFMCCPMPAQNVHRRQQRRVCGAMLPIDRSFTIASSSVQIGVYFTSELKR